MVAVAVEIPTPAPMQAVDPTVVLGNQRLQHRYKWRQVVDSSHSKANHKANLNKGNSHNVHIKACLPTPPKRVDTPLALPE